MKLNTQKTYTQKDGTVWEWTETPATILALDAYTKLVLERRQSEQSK